MLSFRRLLLQGIMNRSNIGSNTVISLQSLWAVVSDHAYHNAWFVVDTASAPADSAVMTCFFSDRSPPDITGMFTACLTCLIMSGMIPDMISMALGMEVL